MYIRIGKISYMALGAVLLCATMADAADKTLSIVSSAGSSALVVDRGDLIALEVRVDDGSAVAGASFTITYDAANLSLSSVESVFFDTFVNQNIPTPNNNQGYITIDEDGTSVNYYSPLVDNPVSGLNAPVTTGNMLAGARVDNGTGTDVTLFTLNFELTGDTGAYQIDIIQSTVDNIDAGYDGGGETIPYLIGIDGSAYIAHNVTGTSSCSLTVNPVDSDGDGIDDQWERDHVPPGTPAGEELDVFTATGDYDHDGYSDVQEYQNRNETDPLEFSYDPTVKNAPGGTGYVPTIGFLPAIYELLLLNN